MIITSLLDNDLYSFTQQQAILHHFPDVNVEYHFKCRNDKDLTPFIDEIKKEVGHLCSLRCTRSELVYLNSDLLSFLKRNYVDFLVNFQLNPDHVDIYIDDDKKLAIKIKGNWFQTVLFEVPILAIVNEIYFTHHSKGTWKYIDIGQERLQEKIRLVRRYEEIQNATSRMQTGYAPRFKFADFGTRRRFGKEWHKAVVGQCKHEIPDNFIGTSNVALAKEYNLKPIGTMSHQWIMAGQGLDHVKLANSQKHMLDVWAREYRGDLGIALSDTVGFDAFLRDFDLYFAKLYDGCRHDSGDPFQWCEKLIAHYKKLKINPMTKSAVFSDGLTFPLALELCEKFYGKINTSFGIGTNLTNDCGLDPLQIVIKVVRVNGQPVAKISDSKGKGMCLDMDFLKYLASVYKIKDEA